MSKPLQDEQGRFLVCDNLANILMMRVQDYQQIGPIRQIKWAVVGNKFVFLKGVNAS